MKNHLIGVCVCVCAKGIWWKMFRLYLKTSFGRSPKIKKNLSKLTEFGSFSVSWSFFRYWKYEILNFFFLHPGYLICVYVCVVLCRVHLKFKKKTLFLSLSRRHNFVFYRHQCTYVCASRITNVNWMSNIFIQSSHRAIVNEWSEENLINGYSSLNEKRTFLFFCSFCNEIIIQKTVEK